MRRSKRTGDARTAEEVQQARKQASLEANNTQSRAKRPGQLPPVGGGARTRARTEPAAVDDEELVSDDTEYIEPGPRVPGESNTYRLMREYDAHHAQIDSAAAQLQLFCAEVHPRVPGWALHQHCGTWEHSAQAAAHGLQCNCTQRAPAAAEDAAMEDADGADRAASEGGGAASDSAAVAVEETASGGAAGAAGEGAAASTSGAVAAAVAAGAAAAAGAAVAAPYWKRGNTEVTFYCFFGCFKLKLPKIGCSTCRVERDVTPAELGCGAPTATLPRQFFDGALLSQFCALQEQSGTGCDAFISAMESTWALWEWNCCSSPLKSK